MPITSSAKKALRQSKKRQIGNSKKVNAYKNAFKAFKKMAASNKDSAKQQLPKVYKAIDKAAKTGVIKKNKAARLKSSAAKLLTK